MLLGAIANGLSIVLGGIIGTKAGKLIPDRHSQLILASLQIVVLILGITIAIKSENILIVVISIVVGGLLGETMDLDKKMRDLGDYLQSKVKSSESNISSGFVSASLVFCVGSMAILASIESGIRGDHSIHFTKAIIDGVLAIFFASTLGIGVSLSGAAVFLYQGGMTLLASLIAPYITTEIMTEVSATGGVLLIALALTMMEIKQIKVANLIPALIVPAILMMTPFF